MIRWRAAAARITVPIDCHTFRATGDERVAGRALFAAYR
jgi:hypothetical protein